LIHDAEACFPVEFNRCNLGWQGVSTAWAELYWGFCGKLPLYLTIHSHPGVVYFQLSVTKAIAPWIPQIEHSVNAELRHAWEKI